MTQSSALYNSLNRVNRAHNRLHQTYFLPASLSQPCQLLMMGVMEINFPPSLVYGRATDVEILFHSVDEILFFLNQADTSMPKLVYFIPTLSQSPRLHVKRSPETAEKKMVQ